MCMSTSVSRSCKHVEWMFSAQTPATDIACMGNAFARLDKPKGQQNYADLCDEGAGALDFQLVTET